MIMSLIYFIGMLVIFGVIWWGLSELLPLIPMPEIIRKIINVLMVITLVIIVVYVLLSLVSGAGFPAFGFGGGAPRQIR